MDSQISTRILPARLQAFPYVTRIGLAVLSTDEIGQRAFEQIVPMDRVSVLTTRVVYSDEGGFTVTGGFKNLLDGFPPAGRVDVVAFSCTSGTVAMGKSGLLNALESGRPGLKCTSPAVGALAALKHIDCKRIAVLTPYLTPVHRQVCRFFIEEGLDVLADATYNLLTDAEIGELDKASLFRGAEALSVGRPDAIFVSCTATPVVPYIEQLETELGMPILTSTQVMAWHALRLGGFNEPIAGFGRLLRKT